MTLPSPILDDRSYAQLRDELIRRIPVYSREWTDHNPSDPGITLIELFAYLGETLLFRFNQIPEATKLEFLRLLQIPLRPPQPATAILRLRTKVALPGVVVDLRSVARAGALPFETQTEVRVLPVSVLAVCKAGVAAPDEADAERYLALQDLLADIQFEPSEDPVTYEPRVVDVDGKRPPINFDDAVDNALWIAVLAAAEETPAELRARLVTPSGGRPYLLNLGFVPDLAVPKPAELEALEAKLGRSFFACPGEGARDRAEPIEWQISTGRRIDGKPVYAPLKIGWDGTRGLEDEGVVQLELPTKAELLGAFEVEPHLVGARDFPPALDDEQEQQLVCWIRAFRRDGAGFGKIQWIGENAVDVIQHSRAKAVFLGTGDGQPSQEVTLIHTPVIPGSVVIDVEEPSAWTQWTEVDSFHASSEDDRHFVVDHQTGQVRFGTGLQGRAPQYGERIRARTWLWGGGVEGNVAVGAISKIAASGAKLEVDNPLPAWGGAAAETIAEGLERIPGELRRRDRCVARDDFRELALQAPGTDLGRAEVLPRFHPPTRQSERAGMVSVVVWPRMDAEHPSAPLPDRRTLRRVCKWLDTRRLVTTELYVIPPRYRKIAVSVGISIKPGHPIDGVRRWTELILRQYLAPLPPYGPSGGGWPLGRRVIAGELEAAVLQLDGVEYIRNLRLAGWVAEPSADDPEAGSWQEVVANAIADPPVEAAVELRVDEVPELAEITVIEGPALVPGDQIDPPIGKTPVPVPIEREEC
jgi:hypothetical protein